MKIALDYDFTYTLDPEFWDEFIKLAVNKKHEVICVTMRYPNEVEQEKQNFPKGIPIISTNRKAKSEYLLEMGISIDVWIDDQPIWILINSR